MDISLLKEKSLMDLREIAKMAGIKSVTKYRKGELLEMLYELDRKAREEAAKQAAEQAAKAPAEVTEEPKEAPEAAEAKEIPAGQQDAPGQRQRREKPRDSETAREQKNGDEKKIIEYVMGNDAVNELLNKGECGDAVGILEVLPEGYGFLRSENYLPGNKDVYVSMAQIRKFNLKTGDKVTGKTRPAKDAEKLNALLYIEQVNDDAVEKCLMRRPFEELTPIHPNEHSR